MSYPETKPLRRPFSAKYAHKKLGIWLIVIGVLAIVPTFLASLILVPVGVYFLRGRGENPAKIEKALQKKREIEARRDAEIAEATRALAAATGGGAFISYQRLANLLQLQWGKDFEKYLEQILIDLKIDEPKLRSPHVGTIPGSRKSPDVAVYRDWIVYFREAYSVDHTTRGEVHLDGNIQFDARNNKIDTRTATVQFVSVGWSKIFPIDVNAVSEARRIIAQLGAIADSMRPSGATRDDISKLIEAIANNTGESAAEKIKQLSDLRYARLLTDEEFESAKSRILDIH